MKLRRIETFPWWHDLVDQKDRLSLRELAERFQVTPGAISAAFRRTGTERRAAPPGPRSRRAAERPSDTSPPRGRGAYLVAFDGGDAPRVVDASSLSEAVNRAESAHIGNVVTVSFVGEWL